MMRIFKLGQLLAFLLLCSLATFPQSDTKQFSKDGLSFSYPSAWAIEDTSDATSQQLKMGRSDSDAQVRLFVYRNKIASPEKLAEARRVLVEPYLESVSKAFEQMGAHPERTPASIDFAGVTSEGVKIRAVLEGEAGGAEIYSALVGQHLVVLTLLGPDKAVKQTSVGWDGLRNTLRVEEPKPEAKPTPK